MLRDPRTEPRPADLLPRRSRLRTRTTLAAFGAALACVVAGTPAVAETATPTILAPAEGAVVPIGFTGPITVDATGDAALSVSCPGIGYTFQASWSGTGVRDTAIAPITQPAACTAQVSVAGAAATVSFQTAQLATITAPAGSARVPTGFTGPFKLAGATGAPGHTGALRIACPSIGYAAETPVELVVGTVEADTAPITRPATDCTATALVDGLVSDTVSFSVWRQVAFSRGLISSAFYPTVRDGFAEKATLSFTVSTATDVTFAVLNADKKVIRRERGHVPAGRNRWRWDGTLHSRTGEKSQPPGVYYMAVVAHDPLSQKDVGLIGETRIKTRILTRNHHVAVTATRARREKRGNCGFVTESGLVGMICNGDPSKTSAQLSHVFKIPAGARPTHYGLHYAASPVDEAPGKIVYGHTTPGANLVKVYVRLNGHRSIIIGDLYVEYTTRVRQRLAPPGQTASGVSSGPVTDTGDSLRWTTPQRTPAARHLESARATTGTRHAQLG